MFRSGADGRESSAATGLIESPMGRLLLLGVLLLMLRIPVCRVERLIAERERFRDAATLDVASSWGASQSIAGPVLALPIASRGASATGWLGPGRRRPSSFRRYVFVLPDTLRIDATLASRVRSRGIFDVSVYEGELRLEGVFAPLDLSSLDVDLEDVRFESASLIVGMSDAQRLADDVSAELDGRTVAFEPGTGLSEPIASGLHAPLAGLALDGARPLRFAFAISLRGSERLLLQPSAERTEVSLRSDWPHPSFVGAHLPESRRVESSGFTAEWVVPALARGYPRQWIAEPGRKDAAETPFGSPSMLERTGFGVSLLAPVDAYRMSRRSIKYELLFTLATLGVVFLLEMLAGIRLHPVQYLFVGGALVLFYLLTLSLSEHLGFTAAYALASAGVVALVTSYASSLFEGRARSWTIGAALAGSYGFLYVLLALQDYSLVAGSIGSFAVLAASMLGTRRVDWYALRLRRVGERQEGTP